MKDDEARPGSSIIRHAARERKFEFAGGGDPELIEAISAHGVQWVGPIKSVFPRRERCQPIREAASSSILRA
jgi:hypothetical protein